MASPLDPRLFDEDDDAEDLAYKKIINQLITQDATPAQAAIKIDEWVVREASKRYEELEQRDPPFTLSTKEKDCVYLVAPNASRHMEMIVGSIATVCSAYAPGHPIQNALIEFIQDLNALPKHEVPDLSYEEDNNEPNFEKKLTLWPFGTPSVEYLAQKFLREADEFAYPFSNVETPGSELQLRWRNLQAFISRLTILELIDCSIASAVPYILPSHHAYPDLEKRSEGGPKRIASDLVAAAQWFEPEEACEWVYDQCKRTGEGDGTRQIWNLANWNQFKEQLTFICRGERFTQETRDLASSLRTKMDAQE